MMRRFWMAVGAMVALTLGVGCGEADNPFTLLIDNTSEEIVSLDGDSGRSSVTLLVLDDGQWREVGEHDNCFRECGESELVCLDAGAPAPGVWALLPGDTRDIEYAGNEWIETTDMRGDCQKEQALSGDLRVEVCFGRGVVDYDGQPWPEAIDESGFVFDADFVEYDCAEVEFTLPGDIEVVVELSL